MKDITILLPLAWRNLWRNKRRTILTLLTLVVGYAMILFNTALFYGGTTQMINDAVAINTGHIQIHETGFKENQTIDYAFIPDSRMVSELDALARENIISGYSMRIQADALLSHQDSSTGVLLQSVDVEREKNITVLHASVLPGGRRLVPSDTSHILVGETLAKNLGAGVDSEVTMISLGFDGSIAAERLVIAGLIKTGNPNYDHRVVLIPHARAVEAFSMGNFVNSIVIGVNDLSYLEAASARIANAVDPSVIEVVGWKELIPDIVQFVALDLAVGYVFSAILFLVVALTVLNSIQMSVYERTREFGVMLSIGTSPGRLFWTVMLETKLIAAIGVAMGLVLGVAICTYVRHNPIDYSSFADEFAVLGVYTTAYPAILTIHAVLFSAVAVIFSALFFSWFPARRAARLNPVNAVRHR